MKDKIGLNDSINIKVHRNMQRNTEHLEYPDSRLVLKSYVDFRIEKPSGKIIPVYKGTNAIQGTDGLKEYLWSRMDGVSADNALDDLFTKEDQAHSNDGGDGTQDNKDGIICQFSDGSLRTTITTDEVATNTFGQKWKGVIKFGQGITTGTPTVTQAILGWKFLGEGLPPPGVWGSFQVGYSVRDFADQQVQVDDRFIFEWEIYM